MPLDRYDAAILDALQKDGRQPIVELAEQVGLSNTPCARRVKLLEQAGSTHGPSRRGKLNTTPMSRPSLTLPERIIVEASASSTVSPSASISGRER